MPGKYGKKKANKHKVRKTKGVVKKRDLPLKEDGQEYAQVTKANGQRRFRLICQDGVERLGILRGSIRKRKKSWVGVGSWLIVGLRDYQDSKADIIEILNAEEVKKLKAYKEIISVEVDEYGNDTQGIEIVFTDGEESNGEIDIDEI